MISDDHNHHEQNVLIHTHQHTHSNLEKSHTHHHGASTVSVLDFFYLSLQNDRLTHSEKNSNAYELLTLNPHEPILKLLKPPKFL